MLIWKRATGERDAGDAVAFDILELRMKVVQHVGDVRWRADGNDRLGFRNAVGRRKHRSPSQRVANDDRRSLMVLAQVIGGTDQVLDIGGKVGVLKLPFGGPESGEIEPQHGNTGSCQARCNVPGGDDVFRACETVREQRIGAHVTFRQIQSCGELMTEASGKADGDRARAHASLPECRRVSGRPQGTVAVLPLNR